jgi:16S rRNA (adenine1518-N6/adenine1519-N6)-dimethyltransferase
MTADSDLPSLREALEAHGLFARKSFGQHFLLDLNLTRRVARTAAFAPGTPVIEVGPGPGGLSRALLEAGADPLIAIEMDPRFRPLLEPLDPWSGGRLRLVVGDALALDPMDLLAAAGVRADQPVPIVANLPYNVGTPLLVGWLKDNRGWRGTMTLMFQKEVAQRICATVGQSAYGRLAVLTQAAAQARLAFSVPARAFVPPPKVESAVVQLVPHVAPLGELRALEQVTAAAFGQRRKMLRSSLSPLGGEALLAAAGVEPTARAEEIDLAGFLRLAAALGR